MRASQTQAEDLYRRLLAGEADAPSDLFRLFQPPLIRALPAKFPDVRDPDIIVDVVTDCLFKLGEHPTRYRPETRKSLFNYLFMDAKGDVLNALKQAKPAEPDDTEGFDAVPTQQRPTTLEEIPDQTTNIEDQVVSEMVPEGLPEGLTYAQVVAHVDEVIDHPVDRTVLDLIVAGERKSEVFSRALGINHLALPEQRRIIKQQKDRIDARLRRLGERIRHEYSI